MEKGEEKKVRDRHDVPFYDRQIMRHEEQEYISQLLEKYRGEPATEELKKKIWEELMMEKHMGRLHIPFKVVLRKDPTGKFPGVIEVLLDTKL